jgi:hypothetical protein
VTLRVSSAGQLGETTISFDPERAGGRVSGASDLSRWALDRCVVRDPESLGAALDRLPPSDRSTAAAFFAHWAAARGEQSDAAARSCVDGFQCGALASLLVR